MNWEAAILNVSLLWILTTPHEFAHAWVASKLGDDTPEREGRVTLHPMAHVDWIGTVLLPAITSLIGGGFIGWGKPVNTNPFKLRWGSWGMALVALAGPASNIVFAIVLAVAATAAIGISPDFAEYATQGVKLSIYLAVFNMIPVPPLDGSKVLLLANLPAAVYNELARFGFLLLMVLLSSTSLGIWISAASWWGARTIFDVLAPFSPVR